MSPRAAASRQGTLRAHEPFDLIRLLARSQPDPRKAVAELVQNSFDAHARRVVVTRERARGAVVLKVADDGDGVLPDLASREESLEYLAKNIGHSRKYRRSPEERRGDLGQYGIGLLGFWAVGEELELRTRVGGSPVLALTLTEDDPRYRIARSAFSPAEGDDPLVEPTCTEVVVRRVHRAAQNLLAGRRLADYLASELRGQLRERDVRLVVRDRLARGRAARLFRVEPRALEGRALAVRDELAVDGRRAARLDLRVLTERGRGGVALACEGAIVADDLAREPVLGLDHAPWTEPRLGGVIDFPDLTPAPGSRRGVVPNAAAEALRRALVGIEDEVAAALAFACAAPARELERESLEQLRRAFANLARELPRYELLAVPGRERAAGGAATGSDGDAERGAETLDDRPPGPEPGRAAASAPPAEPGDPSTLATVTVVPGEVALAPGASRTVVATPRDAVGRPIEGGLGFEWQVEDPALVTVIVGAEDGARAKVTAREREGSTRLRVRVTNGAGSPVEGSATVTVRPPVPRGGNGVPDPHLVDDPGGAWRTRVQDGRWEVNAGHRDYQLVRDQAPRRLQYLVLLLAREVVLRCLGGVSPFAQALDDFAEVAAYALRQV